MVIYKFVFHVASYFSFNKKNLTESEYTDVNPN